MKKYFAKLILICISIQISAQEYSYIWANQYPALADPAIVCCYDFDENMTDDDQIGTIMVQLGGLLGGDPQEYPDELIINNNWVRILRWDTLPSGDGAVTLSVITGSINNPNLNLQERMGGDALVTIDPAALEVFTGTITNGSLDLYATESTHIFLTPLVSVAGSGSGADALFLLPLQDVRIRGNVIQDSPSCVGVCSENNNGSDPAVLGGVEVSGLLHHSDEIDALNNAATNCSCAGVNDNTPLLSYSEDNKALTISCNYQDLDVSSCDDGDPTYCQTIENQCDFAGIQGGFYDQDTNNNGVNDSKSLGGLLGFSSTTVTGLVDIIFEDGFE